ncbi:MAG: sigma-54 dependent transcriptional regulator [Candidatus Pacebacteria bacterium]|nr:sigma-54 dependent transcriptional regulator [Candidatus Paceibacterota bacterium]
MSDHHTTKPATILVIDDEASICYAFERFFEARGYRVLTSGTGVEGLEHCRAEKPEVVFVDVRLPDADGLDLIAQVQTILPASCIVVITAYGSLETVTRAVQEKAFEFLVKPLDLDQAHSLVEQYLHARRKTQRHATEKAADEMPRVIGHSASMQDVFKAVARAAAADASVLITGETGTGKDLIARSIHRLSARAKNAFVAVNCGALPETLVESELFGHRKGAFTGADQDKMGRFEAADGGTLFLDEIGELPPSSQVKLLRFLDSHMIERLGDTSSHHLNVRILAATNQPLNTAMAQGTFRQDLYYRLAVVEMRIPSLRERIDDIVPLAEHFIQTCSRQKERPMLSPQATAVLKSYDWPGNVRELRNAMEHALTMSTGNLILPVHLPHHIRAGGKGEDAIETAQQTNAVRQYLDRVGTAGDELYERTITPVEKEVIQRVLDECQGNQSRAAARLGMHRNTLRRKLKS